MAHGELQTILYVEDDLDIQTVARLALEVVGGFTVHICSSGRAALATVEGELQPDLILLDVMMPEMDGPTTLEALRRLPKTAATPVVFMTAKVQGSETAHYRSLGAIGVIPKPFDPMQLAQQVRALWEQS
jgi:two-component system OmpR family response regulator